MKTFAFLLVTLCLTPTVSFAANSWQCDGGDIEGLSVGESQGKLVGGVSWDCFPGGGVCSQSSSVLISDKDGNTVFQGTEFKLVIETSKAPSNDGEYRATISATDMSDSSDMGRGLTIGEMVTCKKSAR